MPESSTLASLCFHQRVGPNGNPFKEFEGKMLNYANNLPKAHKDKMINQKLDEILTVGIELRLLNREEFLDKLREKVRKGFAGRWCRIAPLRSTLRKALKDCFEFMKTHNDRRLLRIRLDEKYFAQNYATSIF